jgi:hypothetical protein
MFFFIKWRYLLKLFVGRGGEKNEHREELKSSREHIEDENELREYREIAVISRRAYAVQTGTDIVDRCRYRGEVGHEIVILKGNGKK